MNGNTEIKDTIFSFLKNKIPDNALLHFQYWLVQDENAAEKNAVMRQVWDRMDKQADTSEYKDLKDIHRRINYLNRRNRPFYSKFLRAAAILLLPVLSFAASYLYFQNTRAGFEIVQYYVPEGDTKHVILSDGTEIWVNSGSYISYPKKFSGDKRMVSLTGEAYFHVAKSAGRPFVVNTEMMNVEVLGTQFNVNAYPDLNEVRTSLIEGSVAVSLNNGKGNDRYLLTPNEELSVNISTGFITKKQMDPSEIPTWKTGDLLFNSSLMPDILKQLERRYGVHVSCSDKYSERRLTVKFERTESIEDVIRVLNMMIPELKVSKQEEVIYIQ